MKKLRIVFLFSLLVSVATAQMNKIDFVQYDLDNGLHVILHQDKSTPIVAVSVLYHVGSKNENPERTGFAHFFEHLMFEGSKNVKRGEFDKLLSKAGGQNNANTTQDRTFYYEIVPSNQLELAMWLEAERMLHARVDKEGIETQRQVVKEERRQRVDNQPYGSFSEEIFKRAYVKHPYQWPVIGSMAHLDAAKEEDYVNFYKEFYVPNNATLSIAGDIDIEKTKAWVAKYFKDIPKRTLPINRPVIMEPALAKEVRDTVYDNIQLPAAIHAYRIPAQGTDDFYAVKMLATLMSQGESSRLSKAIKDEQQKAIAVGNFAFELENPGLSIAYGIANMGVNLLDLDKAMDIEFAKVQNELVPEKEFQKLRNQTENDFISANTSMVGIAENLANYHVYFNDANLINTEIDRYLKVTREDIKRVANKYFTKNNRVVLYYLPKPPKS